MFPLLGIDIAEFARDNEGRVRDFVVTNEALTNECHEARQEARLNFPSFYRASLFEAVYVADTDCL
ncbi:MAG: hypothetical protein V1796_05150, partial [Pseudomonadota bacterium]